MNVCWRVRVAGQEVEEEPMMGYEAAMKEISVNELAGGEGECVVWWRNLRYCDLPFFADPIYGQMQKKLLEKHQAEKEGGQLLCKTFLND